LEGCGYRDRFEDFAALGVEIVGVSFDSPSRNSDWADDEGFQFELWTDGNSTLAVTYGAASSAGARFADRVTVLLDADGNQVLEYEVSSIGTHPADVLEDCEALFGD
jgi:peroxiredoxin Q/BCP